MNQDLTGQLHFVFFWWNLRVCFMSSERQTRVVTLIDKVLNVCQIRGPTNAVNHQVNTRNNDGNIRQV